MISRIEALYYRSLGYVAQDLRPFQVLVGPNASGKSTFLDVVALLGDFVRYGLDKALLFGTEAGRGRASRFTVAEELRLDWPTIRSLADELNIWPAGTAKPARPKELLETILQRQRRPRSAALFQAIAGRVSLARCVDPAFALLRETLGRWFGSMQSQAGG